MSSGTLPAHQMAQSLKALLPPSLVFELVDALGCAGIELLYHLASGTPHQALILGLAPFRGRHLYQLCNLHRLIARQDRLGAPFPRWGWGVFSQPLC